MHPYFLGKALSGWQISPPRHLSDIASVSIMSFHSSISKQSFSCEFPVASAGPLKLSKLIVLRCSRTDSFYFFFSQEWPSRYVLHLGLRRSQRKTACSTVKNRKVSQWVVPTLWAGDKQGWFIVILKAVFAQVSLQCLRCCPNVLWCE